jgi:hypothetical protein
MSRLIGRGESHGAYDRSRRILVGCSSSGAAAQEKQVTDNQYAELQKNFEDAYNRKHADAMAGAFAESRRVAYSKVVTLSAVTSKTCSTWVCTVQRTISRSQGTFVFNAGEWRVKLGDQPRHGYYTAIIVRDGDRAKIMEETVTIAAPGQ